MTDVDVDHQRELEAVGLLLAGALAPHERMEVERHLRLCDRCRDELVEVAALPALLRRVDSGGTATAAAPPAPAARARLAVTAQTQLHRARRRLALGLTGRSSMFDGPDTRGAIDDG